jgi:hypothetical protein
MGGYVHEQVSCSTSHKCTICCIGRAANVAVVPLPEPNLFPNYHTSFNDISENVAVLV